MNADGIVKLVDIVKRVAEYDPMIASSVDGDRNCFWCHAWDGIEKHEPDCLWVLANELLKGNDPDRSR